MIIGGGMIAQAFAPRFAHDPDILLFASGVSNSGETRPEAFAREQALLVEALASPVPVLYFSSCGVRVASEHQRPYIAHKAKMEDLVLATPGGRVVRLPQVVGATGNPQTLTNFLRDQIRAGKSFELWTRAQRNLIDVDDVAAITAALLQDWPADTRVLDVAAPRSVSMREIVAAMEAALGLPAKVVEKDAGDALPVDAGHCARAAQRLGIHFDAGYTARLLRKYY